MGDERVWPGKGNGAEGREKKDIQLWLERHDGWMKFLADFLTRMYEKKVYRGRKCAVKA